MKQLLKYYCVCLLYLLDFSNGCELPTINNPISVCAFCSENHTGVRWMVHSSHDDRHFFDSKRMDTINIDFQCQDPQGNNIMINHDDCFDGSRLPSVGSVPSSEWRWYVMERNLSHGTECSFTTTLFNHLYQLKWTLETTTCIVEDCSKAGNCGTSPFPAVCSGGGEPGDSVCSCSCSDGFSGSAGRAGGLLCQNIDECSLGTHRCGDVGNCVDTEGGYDCLLAQPTIIDPTTIARVSTPGVMTHSTTLSTSITAVGTKTTSTAACNLPTESDPFSVCAYCSDRRAGVRWMMHESNNRKDLWQSGTYDSISIEFQCRDPQNDIVYQHDDCFDGTRLSVLSSYDPGEWNWYILERELNNGTECSFVTTLRNNLLGSILRLDASTCTAVKECSEDSSDTDCTLTSSSPIPAICSAGGEPMDSECSCSCNNPGFTISRTIYGTTTLQCKNIDECSLGTHRCGDVGNCVDTEGGYDCLSAQSTITDPTTIARVSTPGVMTHSTTLSTSITAVGTKTTSAASTSASADVLQP